MNKLHKKVSRNSFILILSLIIGIIMYFININLLDSVENYDNIQMLVSLYSWSGVLILIYVIVTWYLKTNLIFTPYLIFWIFFFLFNYGQPLMWSLGIHLETEIGTGYTAGVGTLPMIVVLKSQIYTCLCMYFFHLGALFVKRRSKVKRILHVKSIFLVGVILGSISIIPTFYRTIKFLSVSLTYGYNSLYYSNHVSQGGIGMILEMFFFPALVCMLVGGENKKRIRIFVNIIFIMYLFLNLLSGDRGSWIYKMVALIWINIQYYDKIPKKKIIKFIIYSIVGLIFLDVIISFRDIGIKNINIEVIIEMLKMEHSPITKFIFEMGGSMGIISTMFLFPEISSIWSYGNTYMSSILGVLSTRTLRVFGIPFVLVDNWFSQEFLGISWGAGFSMIGEAYLNGGKYFAPLIILLIGFIIGSILYIDKFKNIRENNISFIFITLSLAVIPGISRGSTYLFLKNWFYGALMVVIFIYVVERIVYSKDKVANY